MDVLGQMGSTPIYNRYLNGDFTVGTDNLNPRRELSIDATKDIEELRLALYARYKGQIANLKAAGGGAGNLTVGSPTDLGLPYENRTRISAPISLRDGAAPTDQPVPIETDLNKMLKVIDSFLGGTPITLDDLPFDICNDRSSSSGSASSSTTGGTTAQGATNAGATMSSGLAGASKGVSSSDATGSAAESSDLRCVMVELQMLQAIFQIIAFIKKILAIEKSALSYAYPFIEFVQMVVACILNPSMIPQVVMSVVGQALAAIIGFLTNMISKWLGSLNLDCLMSNTLAGIQGILGTINGVGDMGSAVGSFVTFNANGIAAAEKLGGQAWQAVHGNSEALYRALGIPTDQQASASTMTAGELFDMAANSSAIVSVNSLVGQAKGVGITSIGTVVNSVTGMGKAVNTTLNNITNSAKLIKDYFPGGKFSTF